MQINFKTREQARTFAKQRTAKGFKTPVIDRGPQAVKRYAADIKPQPQAAQ